MNARSILFLQGNASWFYHRLGRALAENGHHVRRVNICGGDWVFWRDWNALDFSDPMAGFEPFLEELMAREGVTDIVLHNDCRAVHRTAIAVAKARDATAWVCEEGYLRPDWLTLERYGINGYSRLPDDPDWYRETARGLPPYDPGEPVGAATRLRIAYDFKWQFANYLHGRRWPHYVTHRPYPILKEYATWAVRLAALRWAGPRARRVVDALARGGPAYFLFPLQLDTDSQIRVHSPFERMPAAIEAVIAHFAAEAPPESRLVIKNHPLDNGYINYNRLIKRLARRRGAADRVTFIDGGDGNALIDGARGVVTVNSTMGLTALERGAAVICLGKAVYDVPGMTHTGGLASFWQAPEKPCMDLLDAYRRVVARTSLINGNFYSDAGLDSAVGHAVSRIESPIDPLADAPPRRMNVENRLTA